MPRYVASTGVAIRGSVSSSALLVGRLVVGHGDPQPLADGGELAIGEFEQPGRQREPSIQIGRVFGGNRTLVADVVLELRPCVLQHGAHLDRRGLLFASDADEQVPAGIAPPALACGLQPHVAVVEQSHLVGEQRRHRVDVLAQIGDDPQPDLVGDLDQRVAEESPTVDDPLGLGGERLDALGARRDAEVVDAGVVQKRRHQLEVVLGGGYQGGPSGLVVGDGRARSWPESVPAVAESAPRGSVGVRM